MLAFMLVGCLGLGGRVAELEEDVKSLSAELTELSLASSPSVGTDAELNALRADVEALQAVVDGQAQAIAELSAELDEVKAGSDGSLAARVYDLEAEVSSLRSSVETLEDGGPQAWRLEEFDPPTMSSSGWTPLNNSTLAIEASGGALYASCWANTTSAGFIPLRIRVTDSTGTAHASRALDNQGVLNDSWRSVDDVFTELVSGAATVDCEGYNADYTRVHIFVMDLGL